MISQMPTLCQRIYTLKWLRILKLPCTKCVANFSTYDFLY